MVRQNSKWPKTSSCDQTLKKIGSPNIRQCNYCVNMLRRKNREYYEEHYNKLNINSITDNKLFWKSICRLLSEKKLSESSKNTFIETFKTEAVIQSCSPKKVFLKVSQNSQENTCARVSFLRHATLLKKTLWHRCFPVSFERF